MMSFIAQTGYATAVLDLTNELSSLLVGLIGLTALSAAMIVVEIIRHRTTQKTEVVGDATLASVEYRKAA